MDKSYQVKGNAVIICICHDIKQVQPAEVEEELKAFDRIVEAELLNVKQWFGIEFVNRDEKNFSMFMDGDLWMRFTSQKVTMTTSQVLRDFITRLRTFGFRKDGEGVYTSRRGVPRDFFERKTRKAKIERQVAPFPQGLHTL
jgi:hypothetical protein